MLFQKKSLLTMAALLTAELLFSQNATADMVTIRATGEITSLSSWHGYSQPIQIGDTWALTYSFLSDTLPYDTTLLRYYNSGTFAAYENSLGWSLTVAGNTIDSAEENAGRAFTGVEIFNDFGFNEIPPEQLPTRNDLYKIVAADSIGNGDFVQISLSASTPIGSTPNLVTSVMSSLLSGIDVSNASSATFTLDTQQFGCLIGNISSIEPVAPVPLPAAAVLFLSSLCGLGGLRIFRKKEAC
jgi:hypothetical protein